MGLFIGNIKNSVNYTLSNATLEQDRAYARNPVTAPVYGVVFDPSGKKITGQRLYDAKNLVFTPTISNASSKTGVAQTGRDDFRRLPDAYENNIRYRNPFDIERVSLDSFNSGANYHYMSLYQGGSNKNVNYYMKFPKFYYCRPQKWEFLISPRYLPGFLPSPMHYRNGHMYNYAYVSKYTLSGVYSAAPYSYASVYSGTTATTKGVAKSFPIENIIDRGGNYFRYSPSGGVDKTGAFRGIYNTRYGSAGDQANTAWPLDYQSLCMLYFLMYIKYNTMYIPSWDPLNKKFYTLDKQSTTAVAPIAPLAETPVMPSATKVRLATVITANAETTWGASGQDGFVYCYSKNNLIGTAYETLGLAGLIGERCLIAGGYVSDQGLEYYDLDRYYSANMPLQDPSKYDYINENLQSDSWNNYQISNKTKDKLIGKEVPANIGFSQNTPWAIFPTVGDSETTSKAFYSGTNGSSEIAQQIQMRDNLQDPTSNYLIHNGMLPNLTGATVGNMYSGDVAITAAPIRGYFVQD